MNVPSPQSRWALLALLLALALAAAVTPSSAKPPPNNVSAGPRVGDPAPWFSGWTPDNVVINRDRVLARPGRAHVLVFFATWCTNCEDELFLIKEARQKVEEAGVDLVLVACGEDAETTMPWLRERGLDGETVLIDRFGQTAKAFGVDDNGTMKLPRTVVLGVKGTVLASFGNEGKRIVKRVLGSIRMDPALRK